MFEHSMDNTFAIETLDPLRQYRYRYDNGIECAYDLVYTAAREPYYQRAAEGSKSDVRDGMYDLVADVPGEFTTGHYEQYGLMSGTLDVNGERVITRGLRVPQGPQLGPAQGDHPDAEEARRLRLGDGLTGPRLPRLVDQPQAVG